MAQTLGSGLSILIRISKESVETNNNFCSCLLIVYDNNDAHTIMLLAYTKLHLTYLSFCFQMTNIHYTHLKNKLHCVNSVQDYIYIKQQFNVFVKVNMPILLWSMNRIDEYKIG